MEQSWALYIQSQKDTFLSSSIDSSCSLSSNLDMAFAEWKWRHMKDINIKGTNLSSWAMLFWEYCNRREHTRNELQCQKILCSWFLLVQLSFNKRDIPGYNDYLLENIAMDNVCIGWLIYLFKCIGYKLELYLFKFSEQVEGFIELFRDGLSDLTCSEVNVFLQFSI